MRALLLSLLALGLGACAATADRQAAGPDDRQRIARAVAPQRWAEAEAPLARLLQRDLRNIKGVSVLVYDQTCAAELRRRRKRGREPEPTRRVF